MCLEQHKQNRATLTSLSLKSKEKIIWKMAFHSYNVLLPTVRIVSLCLSFYRFEEWMLGAITDLITLELLSTCWKTLQSNLCKWSTSIYQFPSTPRRDQSCSAFAEGFEGRNKDTKPIWFCLLLACYLTDRMVATIWIIIHHTLKPVCKDIYRGLGP